MKSICTTFLLFAVLICVFISACDDNNSTGPGDTNGAYKTATITHWGIDFSAGISDTVSWENNDGYTMAWSPAGGRHGEGIWYGTSFWPDRTQNLGDADIHSITSMDTATAAWDTLPPPLSKNDVILAQCLDGFVKFKVTADVDTSSANPYWGIQVMYLFATELPFSK